MTAIVTDVKYRMSLSLIRDLADHGISVVACHGEGEKAYAAASKGVSKVVALPDCRRVPEEFLERLFELCQSCGERPVILPVGAATQELLTSARGCETLKDVCGLCIPEEETLELANDKGRLAGLARRIGVPVPKEYTPVNQSDFDGLPYPVVIKPLCGEKQGLPAERRYVIAGDREQAVKAYENFTFDGRPPVVQEYLSGDGYGYSVLAQDGVIYGTICHKRIREYPLTGGPSTCCQVVDGSAFEKHAENLVKALNFTGIAMIEFKVDLDGIPRLLEINPRVWGTFPLTRISGSSIGYDWYALAAGLEPERIPPALNTRMYYLLSDARRAVAGLKRGRLGEALSCLGDWLLPRAKEGIFAWRDLRPSLGYLASYLSRGLS